MKEVKVAMPDGRFVFCELIQRQHNVAVVKKNNVFAQVKSNGKHWVYQQVVVPR